MSILLFRKYPPSRLDQSDSNDNNNVFGFLGFQYVILYYYKQDKNKYNSILKLCGPHVKTSGLWRHQ